MSNRDKKINLEATGSRNGRDTITATSTAVKVVALLLMDPTKLMDQTGLPNKSLSAFARAFPRSETTCNLYKDHFLKSE